MNIIYARQSIDKKDSLSIESQIEKCRVFAGTEALVFQDKGFSGKNTRRPAFTEMMKVVEDGKVEKIFVYRLDRFSRSIADFSRLWEVLKAHNVEFVSVTENFDTSSPMGRAMLNIVLVFAQLERETTAERVRDNYCHRFSLGAWPGGPAPYGFSLTKITDNERKVSSLVANENAEVVKRIFEDYVKPGASLRSIATTLTAEGIHGPKRAAWDNVVLGRILHSPVYVQATEDVYWFYLSQGLQTELPPTAFDGVHAVNVIGRRDRSANKYNSLSGQMLTVANHNGFIPASLWLQVQDKLALNRQVPRANAGKYSWLTGLMKCGKCGYAVKINYAKAEDKFHLICSGRSNLTQCDASIRIDLRELESYVAARLKEAFDSAPPEAAGSESPENAAELMELDTRIGRLLEALAASSEISAAYVSREIEKLDKQRTELLAHRSKRPTPQKIDFDKLSFEEKKLVASEFISRILISDNNVDICWKA